MILRIPADHSWLPIEGWHLLRLQAHIHPSETWRDLAAFWWWAPAEETRGQYIAYRNEQQVC